MKKTLAALVAVTTIAGSLAVAPPAKAGDGGAIAAGVAGGLIGGTGGRVIASPFSFSFPLQNMARGLPSL